MVIDGPRIGRRRALGLVAVAAAAMTGLEAACSRTDASGLDNARSPVDPSPEPPVPIEPTADAQLLDWTFAEESFGAAAASLLIPPQSADAATARFPLLVALHGRGEARKAPARGARGWPDDYALTQAMRRLAAPPLLRADYLGFVRDPDLTRTNADLAAHPYGGLVVVCPYVPDLHLEDTEAIGAYGRWIVDTLLPRVRRELPVLSMAGAPAATGIDGVSLGGAVALHVGLAHPDTFAAVGTLQAAIDVKDVSTWTERVALARRRSPHQALRLTTSEADPYRGAIGKLSSALAAAGQGHDAAVLPGPHDYPFNRGPGALTMLLWHDRVLRGAAAPG